MMKYVTLSFFILCSTTLWSQTLYRDARTLHDEKWVTFSVFTGKGEITVTPENANQVLALLYPYLPDQANQRVDGALDAAQKLEEYKSAFRNNPFITIAGSVQSNPLTGLAADAKEKASKTISAAASMNISTVVDGVAKFLVKRTKEELTNTFFEKFEKELQNQKDLRKLFPTTFTILSTAGSEAYNYQVYLPALREAFEADLDNFFASGFEWMKSSEGKMILEIQANPALYASLKASFLVGRELNRGQHPGEVWNSLTRALSPAATVTSDKVNLAVLHRNVPAVITTVNIFSQALRSGTNDRYWITESDFRSFENLNFLKIFMGLIYQDVVNQNVEYTTTTGTVKLSDLLTAAAKKGHQLKQLVETFKQRILELENRITVLTQTEIKKTSDYVRLAKEVYAMIPALTGVELIGIDLGIPANGKVAFYAEHLSQLWSHLEKRSYHSAVFEAYLVLDSAVQHTDNRAGLKAFLKYGNFMASVASAGTADEVMAAIETVALPPGSASIKRKTKSNVALNGFVGISPGYEWKTGDFDSGKFSFGVFAPIGIAFSKGWYAGPDDKNKYTEKGCGTFFISLVDLGAVTAFRFNDDEAAALPELTLSNIFAPGLYFIHGFKNSPVSLGLGGQLGPQLRKITADEKSVDTGINYTAKLFIAIDIPLINFRSTPR